MLYLPEVSLCDCALTQSKLGLIYKTFRSFLIWKLLTFSFCWPGSSVGTETGYGLDGPGIESRWGRGFLHLSRPVLGPTPTSCTMGTGSFQGVKSGRGVTLTPHPLLVPWSWKSSAIPLLPLWAVRPIQSLSACTRVTFTFTYFLPTVLVTEVLFVLLHISDNLNKFY